MTDSQPTSQSLLDQYNDYYTDGRVDEKRGLTAKLVYDRFVSLGGACSGRLIDVGCGEGSLLSEFSKNNCGSELYGVEISQSGVDRVASRNLPRLKDVRIFDGYAIPYPDKYFELAVAVHVLEHVEHERRLITELARVSRRFFIEIPLEDGLNLDRAIEVGKQFGHINFYSSRRFLNILETTAGVGRILKHRVSSAGLEYEQYLYGRTKGTLKHFIRSGLLNIMPRVAERRLTYFLGVLCESKT